eukprot:scpid86421/ scgid14458/ 
MYVKGFKLLSSKLPKPTSGKTRLFQQVKKHATRESTVWYNGKPLGKNTLGSLMSILSVKCNLSQRYTNHSVRASTITELCRQNLPASTIMAVSGHKCQQSLVHYNRPTEADKLKTASLLHVPDTTPAEPVHPELTGIDLDDLFQPAAPPELPLFPDLLLQPQSSSSSLVPAASNWDADIDALIASCTPQELQTLETKQPGTSVFQSCNYSNSVLDHQQHHCSNCENI